MPRGGRSREYIKAEKNHFEKAKRAFACRFRQKLACPLI